MPNLFPEDVMNEIENEQVPEEIEESDLMPFRSSWKFDFEKGEFVLDPNGRVVTAEPIDAWIEWCKKAIQTPRYRHLIYSDDLGHEFEDLIRRNLSREANESEIERIVTECLMVNPRTERVDNFQFTWEGDRVYFTFDIYNILGESTTLDGSVVMNS